MLVAKNNEELQKGNLHIILELLRDNRCLTRQDIVEATGLSPSGVSKLTGLLLDKGLILEENLVSRRKGRRAINLKIDENRLHSVGVRLARNYVKCGLFNLKGDLQFSSTRELSTKHLEETKNVLDELISRCLAAAKENGCNVYGIGVSAPGPLFSVEGRIVLTSNYPEWQGFSVKDFISERFGLPTFVEHDANVSVLAERWFGEAKGLDDVIYVVVDRGVGAGIFARGEVYKGHLNVAGEIGHTTIAYDGPQCECGNRGCLEMFCSSHAVLAKFKEVKEALDPPGWPDRITIDEVARLVAAGDEKAVEIVCDAGRCLGVGLVNLINSFNPPMIILGDEMTKAGKVWFDAVVSEVKKRVLPEIFSRTRIEVSELPIEPAFLGTGALISTEVFTNVANL